MTVPLAALESVVIARAPWWALPMHSMAVSAVWALMLSTVIFIFLLRAQRGMGELLLLIGGLWGFFSALTAVRIQNPGLGFFTVFVVGFFLFLSTWVRHELSRSFINPNVRWYEGTPGSIPALTCEITQDPLRRSFRVARLDEEGAFLHHSLDQPGMELLSCRTKGSTHHRKLELHFQLRGREVRCFGTPMLFFKRSAEGLGLRFLENTPDSLKELSDFVEELRGEGYV